MSGFSNDSITSVCFTVAPSILSVNGIVATPLLPGDPVFKLALSVFKLYEAMISYPTSFLAMTSFEVGYPLVRIDELDGLLFSFNFSLVITV